MTAILDLLDGPWPDALRYALSAWFAVIAAYLVWCGRQLQLEQDATDRLASGAPPPGLTVAEPPPAPGLLPRQANDGNPSRGGGISHPERLRLERLA